MTQVLKNYVDGISELFWLGYIIGWIGVFAYVGGALMAVWLFVFIFGAGLCLIDTLVNYYRDYLVGIRPSTEE
jgi:hypothetical protein